MPFGLLLEVKIAIRNGQSIPGMLSMETDLWQDIPSGSLLEHIG